MNLKDYNINNIVLACHICNAHKRDFFSQKEFKEIAEKFISPKIKRFISNQGLK